MPHHPSYHGKISGKEAERRLTEHSEGNCYLTRFSEHNESYAVSAIISHYGTRELVHLVLDIDSEASSYSFERSGKVFRTIEELLSYYQHNPLNEEIRSIGSICYPRESPDQPPEQRRQRTRMIPSPQQQDFPPLPEEPGNQNEVHQLIEIVKQQQEAFTKQMEAHEKELKEERATRDELMETHEKKLDKLYKQHRKQMEEQRKCSIL